MIYIIVTILIQILGPIYFSFADWANIIQYLSGFGMAYAFYEYIVIHKPQIKKLEKQMLQLHSKHEEIQASVEKERIDREVSE